MEEGNNKLRKLRTNGKKFRKSAVICIRKLFGCYYLTKSEDDLLYAYQKTKPEKPEEAQNVSKNFNIEHVFSKLETVLTRSFQLQSQDIQFRHQLRESLLQITGLLEKIGSQPNLHCCNLHDKIQSSKIFPNFSNFKFQIKLSKGNLITCVNNPDSKSLDFIEENDFDDISENSLVLHRCESQIFDTQESNAKRDMNEQVIDTQSEKCVQSSIENIPNCTSLLMDGQILRNIDHFANVSQFNLATFKVSLVEHIKSVKNDVLSLKNLLVSIEQIQNLEKVDMNKTEFGCIVNMDKYMEEQKFMEAQCRARTFVKFWRMQTPKKSNSRKKNTRSIKQFDFCNLHVDS